MEGSELGTLNRDELTIFRRRQIGFIFQNYNLVPVLNSYENIILPLELDGREVNQEYVTKILKIMHLSEKICIAIATIRWSATESCDC